MAPFDSSLCVCVCVCVRSLVTGKQTASPPGRCCSPVASVRSGSSSPPWTPWLPSSPCQCPAAHTPASSRHLPVESDDHMLNLLSLTPIFVFFFNLVGFSSCATCLSTWPAQFRRCCGRPTGDLASNTTTGERQTHHFYSLWPDEIQWKPICCVAVVFSRSLLNGPSLSPLLLSALCSSLQFPETCRVAVVWCFSCVFS